MRSRVRLPRSNLSGVALGDRPIRDVLPIPKILLSAPLPFPLLPTTPERAQRAAEASRRYAELLASVPAEERRLTGETENDPETARVIALVRERFRQFPGGAVREISHWRSYGAQSGIVISKLRGYGIGPASTVEEIRRAIEGVLRASAMPGFSRHHWGTEIDAISTDEAFWSADPSYAEAVRRAVEPLGFYPPYRDGHFPRPVEPHFVNEPWHLSYFPIAHGLREAWLGRVNVPLLLDRLALTLGGALDVPPDRLRAALGSLNLRSYHENVAPPPASPSTDSTGKLFPMTAQRDLETVMLPPGVFSGVGSSGFGSPSLAAQGAAQRMAQGAATGFTTPAVTYEKMRQMQLGSARPLDSDVRVNVVDPTFKAAWSAWYEQAWLPFYEKYAGDDPSTLAKLRAAFTSDEVAARAETYRQQLADFYVSYSKQKTAAGLPVPAPTGASPALVGPAPTAGWTVPWWLWGIGAAGVIGLGYGLYLKARDLQNKKAGIEKYVLPKIIGEDWAKAYSYKPEKKTAARDPGCGCHAKRK